MGVNWIILGVVFIFVIILVVFLVRRNSKDEEDLEKFLDKNEALSEKEKEEDELNNYL